MELENNVKKIIINLDAKSKKLFKNELIDEEKIY